MGQENRPLVSIPPSTTYGIDELRAETIAIRKLQALEDAQAVAITVSITQSNEAVYYGADMKGGTWKIVTPPMTYQETKAWVILTALTQSYGKGANWGLYTSKSFDACTMAWDLGLGGMPISIPRVSFSDQRDRHKGISHHSITVLKEIVRQSDKIELAEISNISHEYHFVLTDSKNGISLLLYFHQA